MIVRMGLLTRAEDVSVEQFRHHWRTVHGPLAARLPGLRAYHQNHVVDAAQLGIDYPRGDWAIDGLSELWFDDLDAMHRAIASDAYAPIAADSGAFVGDTRVIVAEQQVVVPVPEGAGPPIKRMSILTAAPGCDPDRFRHEWWTVHAPMVRAFPAVAGYTQNLVIEREAVPGASALGEAGREAVPADGIVEMWFQNLDDLHTAFASDAAKTGQAHARAFIGEITTFLVETHRIV